MLRKRGFWIGLVVLVVLVGGGYAAYTLWWVPKQTARVGTTLQTATATIGDITVSTTGSGTLMASQTANLTFGASAEVTAVSVQVGDHVNQGDVLARADDTAVRQTLAEDQQAVISAQIAVTTAQSQAELSVAQAEAALATAQASLAALTSPDPANVETAKATLANAQVAYQTAVKKAGMVGEQNASVRISLDQAIAALDNAQSAYAAAMDPAQDWVRDIETTRQSAASAVVGAQQNLEIAQANYDLAMVSTSSADVQTTWAQVVSAKEALAGLEGPTAADLATAQAAVQSAQVTLEQAKLELGGGDRSLTLQQAQLALEQAQLTAAAAQATVDSMTIVAPFTGTVEAVNATVGEIPSDTAIILADLDTPILEFWIDETDLTSAVIGNPVSIVFTALPNLTFSGQIYQVDPQLVTVSNTPAVQAWSTLETISQPVTLLDQMDADITIIAAQATNVVLVPVQAVRTMANGQHVVFVVQPDGTLQLRQVEVGISNYIDIEITSGLSAGEVVSLGNSSSSTSSQSTPGNTGFPGGGGFFPGGGGFSPGGVIVAPVDGGGAGRP